MLPFFIAILKSTVKSRDLVNEEIGVEVLTKEAEHDIFVNGRNNFVTNWSIY